MGKEEKAEERGRKEEGKREKRGVGKPRERRLKEEGEREEGKRKEKE